jgi:tRNA (cytidine/uridine-2'-O-)-methyltransferase
LPQPGRSTGLPSDIPELGLFRIALVEPEIPPNVGAVSRTCAAAGCPLYLVGHIGFREDHPARRRAGLDYWDLVDKHRVASIEEMLSAYPKAGAHFLTKKAEKTIYEVDFQKGDFLVFGRESTGFSREVLERYRQRLCRIPMRPGIRSLNLSTSVGVALYEAVRQVCYHRGMKRSTERTGRER